MSNPRILFVLLHGYNLDSSSLGGVKAALKADAEAKGLVAEFHDPDLPLSVFSRADPLQIAEQVAVEISDKVAAAEREMAPFDRIVLVGHSVGALLARKIYIIACGETAKAPLEAAIRLQTGAPWAGLVDRVVLLAGVNRGWRVTHHLGLGKALLWTFGIFVAALLRPFGRRPVMIMQVRTGSEFITNLRIQWLRMRRRCIQGDAPCGGAMVVQLLGSIDDFVSPADTIDPTTGNDFIYLDVPKSGHSNIVEVTDDEELPESVRNERAVRRETILLAALGGKEALQKAQVVPYDANETAIQRPDVKTVVFVVHGIRDGGFWTHKVARTVQKASDKAALVATETSTYGYFPMLSFLLSWQRRRKAEWLMEQYTEALACYPNAAHIHFVGHSNGTYCLADALRRYACCHFDHVVFAGSVVRTDYPWEPILANGERREQLALARQAGDGPGETVPDGDPRRRGSVRRLLNIVATGDWVVAGFPNLFERWLPIQRLGGAGHFGFGTQASAVTQLRYAKGGHGAGIQEPLWEMIAQFVTKGTPPAQAAFKHRRNPLVRLLGLVPPIAWLLAALVIVVLGKLVQLGAAAIACRSGPAPDACLASLPSVGTALHPANWLSVPPVGLADWIVPIAVLLYLLLVIKLLRWV